MKNQEVKSTTPDINYKNALSVIIPRQNGTPAGVSALAASLIRGTK